MGTKNPRTLGYRYAINGEALDAADEPYLNPYKNERKNSWNAEHCATEWAEGFRKGVEENTVSHRARLEKEEEARLRRRPFYHVTSRECEESILSEGFAGSWGDDGFGVYLFDGLSAAAAYALRGGWDESLTSAVILEVWTDPDELDEVIPDSGWPNPEDYGAVRVHRMDEDDPEPWEPEITAVSRDELETFDGFKGSPLEHCPKAAGAQAGAPCPT